MSSFTNKIDKEDTHKKIGALEKFHENFWKNNWEDLENNSVKKKIFFFSILEKKRQYFRRKECFNKKYRMPLYTTLFYEVPLPAGGVIPCSSWIPNPEDAQRDKNTKWNSLRLPPPTVLDIFLICYFLKEIIFEISAGRNNKNSGGRSKDSGEECCVML